MLVWIRPIGSNCSYEPAMADGFSHHFVLCKADGRLRFHDLCNFSCRAALREQCLYWGWRQGFRYLFGVNSPAYGAESFNCAIRMPALSTGSSGSPHRCSFRWASWQRALRHARDSMRCHGAVRATPAHATPSLCYESPEVAGPYPGTTQSPCKMYLLCATLAASHAFLPSLAPWWPFRRGGAGGAPLENDAAVLESLHPHGDTSKALAFPSEHGFPGLYVCVCWWEEK